MACVGTVPRDPWAESELLDALSSTSSATSALVEILLVRANLLPKAKRFSRFTFLNQPCHETTCRLFTFSLGLVGVPNLAMANSRKDLGLLAGTFLVGLGALEMVLYAFG